MTWQDEIREGMKMIISGCKKNTEWWKCETCPFDNLCTSICLDEKHSFSTPDCYEEEGIFL